MRILITFFNIVAAVIVFSSHANATDWQLIDKLTKFNLQLASLTLVSSSSTFFSMPVTAGRRHQNPGTAYR